MKNNDTHQSIFDDLENTQLAQWAPGVEGNSAVGLPSTENRATGSGRDSIVVLSTRSATTLNTGDGSDEVQVRQSDSSLRNGNLDTLGGTLTVNGGPGKQTDWLTYKADNVAIVNGPLFWLARRLAKTRERLGLHYPSDSDAGRHLAGRVWAAIFSPQIAAAERIPVPTLARIVARATAEWQ